MPGPTASRDQWSARRPCGRIRRHATPSPRRWWSCRHRLRRNTPRRDWTCRPGSTPCPGRAVWCSSDPLMVERFGQLVEAAEIDAVGNRRQLEPGYLDLVELFCALGSGSDPRGVLDGLGEKTRKITVGQRDSG